MSKAALEEKGKEVVFEEDLVPPRFSFLLKDSVHLRERFLFYADRFPFNL